MATSFVDFYLTFYDKIATIGADPSSNVANLTLGKHWINTVFYQWLSLITTEKYKPQSHTKNVLIV